MSAFPPAAILPPALPPAAQRIVLCWKARCAALLCLAAATFAAPSIYAQATGILTTIGTFNKANGSGPNQALILGTDSNFYGVAPSGGPNNLGTFYRVAPNGTISLIYSFGDGSGAVSPSSPLVRASDGSFYGIATPTTNTTTVSSIAYRVTTTGIFGIVHSFAPNTSSSGITTGATLVPGLTVGSDGALYGVTQNGGNKSAANTAGDGTIFRLTPTGDFTTLYSFDFNRTGVDGSIPSVPLTLGSDGNFYGLTVLGGTYGGGTIFRMTPRGTVTTIHNFSTQEGGSPVGALVEGERGIFYGINITGGTEGFGTFFSVTGNGVLNTLHNFTSEELGSAQQANGQTNQQTGLFKATDGNFYLTVQSNSSADDHFLQLSPQGVVIPIFPFTTDDGYVVVGALAQAGDGSFYGTTATGGATNVGTVFRLTFQARPSFYDGQVDLSNGVEYLQFGNGNIFGYYSFLSDPRYIYHFDLGYEYVIDAQDGAGGVYLYDFRSEHFFYTSPRFSFPYLYDFTLDATLYYYPDPNNPGRYNINGLRYFYNFDTRRVITQ